MMRLKSILQSHGVISVLLILVILAWTQPTFSQDAGLSYDFSSIVRDISMDNVKRHIAYLTSLDSRVSGYPGFFNAVNYVVSNLEMLGVKPFGYNGSFLENFTITVPMDHGSYIQVIGGPKFKAYALWPNYVNPSPYVSPDEGDDVVDVGKGLPEDFDGKNVSGRFVLMDFDSRWFFRFAIMYGAKGVIYVGDEITRPSAFQIAYNIPLMFPRLYLSRSDGLKLREILQKYSNIKVRVVCNMTWEAIQVPNIVGLIPGQGELANEYVVLSAHLDSWSIVPTLAPGATDALNPAVLLETARVLIRNPVQRSVIILVTAGHWEGLWGAREWVENHWDMVGTSIKAFASLDLSYDSNQLSLTNVGSTYSYANVQALNVRYQWLVDRFFKRYIPTLREIYGSDFGANFIDKILLTYPPAIQNIPVFEGIGTTSYDSEPYTSAAYGGGFAFHTSNSLRIWAKTPNDTLEKVDFRNLEEQAIAIICSIWALANEPRIELTQSPARVTSTGEWGYCTLIIQVVEYNMTTAFWDAFTPERHPSEWKDLIVSFSSRVLTAGSMLGASALGGVIDIVAKPNEKGEVVIHGLKPLTGGIIGAYVINRTNGEIEWANDMGVYRAPNSLPGELRITSVEYRQMVSIFPCGSIALFSLFNPNDLTAIGQIVPYNFLSHGPMIRYSYLPFFYGDTMIFVMPDTPTEILLSTGGRFPIGVLLNASENNRKGWGYIVRQGETLRISFTPLKIAEDIFLLTTGRSEVAERFNTYNPSIVLFEGLGRESFFNARKSYEEGFFAKSYSLAYSAWAFISQAYSSLMDLIWQVIYGIVFITMLLILFAVVLERLLYSKHGLRRIIFIVCCFLAFLIFISFFHPGFHIATNAAMVIIAFGIIAVTIPLLGFILGEASATAKVLRKVTIGEHIADISRLSVASASFTVGIENMKRRRFRTLLSLTSITLIVFSLVTFTSITATPMPREDKLTRETPYPGFLVRKYPWTPIPEELYFQLKYQYGDAFYITPRVWIFPPPPPGGGLGFITFTNKTLTTIGALWGLTPEESNVTGIDESILSGGRWIEPGDLFVCLISSSAAENLTRELGRPINVGSTIRILGVNLTVIGLFDGSKIWSGAYGIKDLDDEPITPLMPIVSAGEISYTLPPHFTGDEVIIIPYELAVRIMETSFDPYWRFFLSSVAIRLKDRSNINLISKLARDVALRSAIDVCYTASEESIGTVSIIRSRQWYTATGMETFTIPLVIGCFIMLNMMFSAVYERIREIKIFAAVGLSPLHISLLFLVESATYAIVGCVLGYLMGVVGCWIFSSLALYPPGFYPNFSSYLVLLVVAMGIGITLLSTLYPASKASSVALPSLERKWRLPMPTGNVWSILMPFVATTESEAIGIMAFMKEYLEAHSMEGVGSFITKNVKYSSAREADSVVKKLSAYVTLVPLDAGVAQHLSFIAISKGRERFNLILELERERGLRDIWITSNRTLINEVRKQLLIWRTLPSDQKRKYIDAGRVLEDYSSKTRYENLGGGK